MGILNQLQYHTKCIDEELIKAIFKIHPVQRYYHQNNFLIKLKEAVIDYNMDIKQVLSYLERVDTYQAVLPVDSIGLWVDYLSSAKQLGYDKFDKYPSSLKREHDVFARELVNKKDEIEEKSFAEQMDAYKDIEYSNEEYCIVVPLKPEDLKKEGRELNHCVGTYVSKVANGNSKIFFIRKKDEIDKSLYTLEVINGRMAQYRGKFNCTPPTEAIDFANNFILEKIKGLKKGEVAGLAM